MPKEIKSIGTQNIQQANPVKAFRPVKQIVDLFKQLDKKRTEVRDMLYDVCEQKVIDKSVLVDKNNPITITYDNKLITLTSRDYFVSVYARFTDDNVFSDLLIEAGRKNKQTLSHNEEETLLNNKLILFNHESGTMTEGLRGFSSDNTYAKVFPLDMCDREAPEQLTNSLEKTVPCKWVEDIVVERGGKRSPTYYSIVEIP